MLLTKIINFYILLNIFKILLYGWLPIYKDTHKPVYYWDIGWNYIVYTISEMS